MSVIRNKLRQKNGVSIFMGLMFLLVCLMVGSVVLTAATAASGKLARQRQDEQDYLTVASAARLLKNRIGVLTYKHVHTEVKVDGAPSSAPPDETVLTASDGEVLLDGEDGLKKLCTVAIVSEVESDTFSIKLETSVPHGGTSALEPVYGSLKLGSDGRILISLWLGDPDEADSENRSRVKIEFAPDGPIESTEFTSEEIAPGSIKETTITTKTCTWPEDGCTMRKGTP